MAESSFYRAPFRLALSAALAACSASNDFTIAPNHQKNNDPPSDVPASLASGRLPPLARPTHYGLTLTIDPKKTRFTGRAVISAEVPQPTDVIVLHARDMTFTEASVVFHEEALTVTATPRASTHDLGSPDELVLSLPRKVDGTIEIDLGYSASFSDQLVGAYRVESGGDAYVFTQFEPMDARRAFPCFDEPGFKVPVDLSIATPVGNIAVANTVETLRTPSDDKKSVTFKFAPTQALPTYLIAFAVGPLEVREAKAGKVPLRIVTTKGKSALGVTALEAARSDLDILEKYFDRPYPFDKLDLVAVPDFSGGAMENAGLITFREELILVDPKLASASTQRSLGLTIAHEIAHHWFGDLVTMTWWDDLWLNEGFATWMESKVVDTAHPELQTQTGALAWHAEAMELDARSSARPVRRKVESPSEAEEAFDAIVYDKGAAVLGMLESWLGPEKFQAGVRQYLKAHAYGSATATDLFQALSEASGKDVVAVASSFLDQPGVPLVKAKLACAKNAPPRLTLTQKRLLQTAPGEGSKAATDVGWKIPVCVGYEGDKGTPLCTVLDAETSGIVFPKGQKCPKWIIPNVGQHGYYRYSIAEADFRALAKIADKLDAVTRFGLLDNAHALLESGDLDVDVLFDLVDALAPKPRSKLGPGDRLAIEEEVSILVDLSSSVIDDASRPAFAELAKKVLLPLAKELGFDPKKGESDDARLLRRALFDGLVALVDDPWIEAESEKRAKAFLADPTSVDIDTAAIALRASSRHANAARLDALRNALEKTQNPQVRVAILGALGSFEDPLLLGKALDSIVDGSIKKQDGRYIVRAASSRPRPRQTLLVWLGEHAALMKEKLPTFTRVGFVELLKVCDAASLDKAHSALDGKLTDAEGGERAVAQLYERAALCIDLAARERARVHARFKTK